MTKPVSFAPDSFSDSFLLLKSREYEIPGEAEKRSKFSVSGFPTKLLNVIYYTLPGRLDGKWRKSLASVERFLFSVGIPLLNKATEACTSYSEMMADAVDKDDDNRQLYLRSLRFLYAVEDMRLTGGREVNPGGVALRCLDWDAQVIKDVQIRLAGVSQSTLVTLAIVWALSTDNDCQCVASPIQSSCSRVVDQFKERVADWDQGLRNSA